MSVHVWSSLCVCLSVHLSVCVCVITAAPLAHSTSRGGRTVPSTLPAVASHPPWAGTAGAGVGLDTPTVPTRGGGARACPWVPTPEQVCVTTRFFMPCLHCWSLFAPPLAPVRQLWWESCTSSVCFIRTTSPPLLHLHHVCGPVHCGRDCHCSATTDAPTTWDRACDPSRLRNNSADTHLVVIVTPTHHYVHN